MTDLTSEEIIEGKKQLKGPRVVFWISLVLGILGVICGIVSLFNDNFSFAGNWIQAGSVWGLVASIFELLCSILFVILFWIELAGLIKGGKSYTVGLGRFLLIWMMIFSFPVGTIIGAIVWKRFSDQAVQKYLNYLK